MSYESENNEGKRESLAFVFEVHATGEEIKVTVDYPKGNAIAGLAALHLAGSDQNRMKAIYELRDEPSIGPLLVEYQIDFSDPTTLEALNRFGLEER